MSVGPHRTIARPCPVRPQPLADPCPAPARARPRPLLAHRARRARRQVPKSAAWLELGKADQALKRSQMQDRLQAQKEVPLPRRRPAAAPPPRSVRLHAVRATLPESASALVVRSSARTRRALRAPEAAAGACGVPTARRPCHAQHPTPPRTAVRAPRTERRVRGAAVRTVAVLRCDRNSPLPPAPFGGLASRCGGLGLRCDGGRRAAGGGAGGRGGGRRRTAGGRGGGAGGGGQGRAAAAARGGAACPP